MNPGELRHRIELQTCTSTQDADGFEQIAWTTKRTVWAKAENLYGKEYWSAKAVQSEKTVKFIIRYTADINNAMRILFRGTQFNIVDIDNIKYGNTYMEIKAEEVL